MSDLDSKSMINYLLLGPDEAQERAAGGEHAFADVIPREVLFLENSYAEAFCNKYSVKLTRT